MGLTVNQWLGEFESHIRSQSFRVGSANKSIQLVIETAKNYSVVFEVTLQS